MSNAAKLRKKAAEFEVAKQTDRAIAVYVQAIDESEAEGEEVDVALLNKVGDLALRQGRVADAVTYYERAVEHYANAGLFNNAIALCNKLLRSAPGRSNVYFTLGRICARKGLRSDATRNFLEYATRMQQDGRVDEGMRALAEVADLMPELTEIRRLVDEHAVRAGITLQRRGTPLGAAAVTEPASQAGLGDKSGNLVFLEVEYEARAARRTPSHSVSAPPSAAPLPPKLPDPKRSSGHAALNEFLLFDPENDDSGGLDFDDEIGANISSALGVPVPGLTSQQSLEPGEHLENTLGMEPTALAGSDVEAASGPVLDSRTEEAVAEPPTDVAPVAPVSGLVTSTEFDRAGVPKLEGFTSDEFVGEEAVGSMELDAVSTPVFRLDPHNFILSGELPPLVLDDAIVDAALAAPALLAALVPARAASATPSVPMAAVAAEANAVAESRRDFLRAAVAETPRDWLLRRRLAEALFEAGERDAALAELETALAGFLEAGELEPAAELADQLVLVARERVPYHQKRVELAVRLHDNHRLRDAYLDLADALLQSGDEGRARAVYARVLEIDPQDDRARSALGASAPPVEDARPDDAQVGLADWLRDDDAPASTRMRMKEPTATGDEQADFDLLLRHFKEGVARSLGEEDYESHYDLGVAFKEMGLLDDAVGEFQKALRSRTHRLAAYEALGQCFVEQERYQVAATVLSRAMHEPGLSDEQRVGVLYLLAYSSEALQRSDEARSYYQRVYATDINFRDVSARLAALEPPAS